MAQALAELRAPVGQEALRLRMAAMHGRDDQLLEAARFPRLLRQANDAEVADVRKVGDDDYEISPHRNAGLAAMPPLPPASVSTPEAGSTSGRDDELVPVAELTTGPSRDNGQPFGVRFRRRSRGPMRAGEIPLIGVVQIEVPIAAPEETVAPDETVSPLEPIAEAEVAPPARKPVRPKRAPRKKAASAPASAAPVAAASTPEESSPEAAPARAKRPRRARKKAE
ncbi:MAG: hypothetical protein H0T44_06405 [Gemmatimonadales bacterium]|nr:hypothetical protein [Gemmatimonadales bacterium]